MIERDRSRMKGLAGPSRSAGVSPLGGEKGMGLPPLSEIAGTPALAVKKRGSSRCGLESHLVWQHQPTRVDHRYEEMGGIFILFGCGVHATCLTTLNLHL
jgi:hypothetical protein